MEKAVFNKRLKIGVIVFVVFFASMSIVWFGIKTNNSDSLENDSAETLSTKVKNVDNNRNDGRNIEANYGRTIPNEDDYVEKLSFEEALKILYIVHEIKEDPRYYKNYQETILEQYGEAIIEWWFLSIDNYRKFLSDESECNKGKESLKSFIFKIGSDKQFLKSRTTISAKYLKDLPTFKFHFEMTPEYCGNKICGSQDVIYSWEELHENNATFIITAGYDVFARYTFSRKKGVWFLTEYYEPNWY